MSGVRRVFYDLEFLEDGHSIDVISIGLTDEDRRELYLVNGDFNLGRLRGETWLEANVAPYLPVTYDELAGYRWGPEAHPDFALLRSRERLAEEVRRFLTPSWALPCELWGYFPAYDHVALSQLWGRMTDRPRGVPWRTRDVMDLYGSQHRLPPPGPREHHALEDARWTKDAFQRATPVVA